MQRTDAEDRRAGDTGTYAEYAEAGGQYTSAQWKDARYFLRRAGQDVVASVRGPRLQRKEERKPEPLPSAADYDGDVAAYYEAVKAVTKAKIGLVDKPTTIEWTAPDDNWCGFVFLGDIHIGGLIDYDQLEADIAIIRDTPGLRCILTGDYSERFEGSGKLQHAMAGDIVPGSDDQEILVLYSLSGLAGLTDLVLAGNHDDFGGGEGVRRLAKRLGAVYVTQAGCMFKASVGSEQYVLYIKHQYTGASRISTSNEGRRFWTEFGVAGEYTNADVTVLAHLHQPDTHQVERKGNTITHLRGGTYKTVDPWARKGGYSPAYGPALVLLNPREHEVIPFHGPLWRRGVQMLGWLRNGR